MLKLFVSLTKTCILFDQRLVTPHPFFSLALTPAVEAKWTTNSPLSQY